MKHQKKIWISFTMIALITSCYLHLEHEELRRLEHAGPAVYSAIASNLNEYQQKHKHFPRNFKELAGIELYTINGTPLKGYFNFHYFENDTLVLTSKKHNVTCIYQLKRNVKSNHNYYGKCYYPKGLVIENYKGYTQISS